METCVPHWYFEVKIHKSMAYDSFGEMFGDGILMFCRMLVCLVLSVLFQCVLEDPAVYRQNTPRKILQPFWDSGNFIDVHVAVGYGYLQGSKAVILKELEL